MLDRAGRSELHYAAKDNDVHRVRRLVAEGADVNLADFGQFTPLHMAAQRYAVEAARCLIELGANLDPRDSLGNTPLGVALVRSAGRGEMIELLLESGADPDIENDSGSTPRIFAYKVANFDLKRFFE